MEELLKQLLDEMKKMRLDINELREIVYSQSKTIDDLKGYISDIYDYDDAFSYNSGEELADDYMISYDKKDEKIDEKDNLIKLIDDNNKIIKDYEKNNIDKSELLENNKEKNDDDSKYIPGTNFLKPRDRKIGESDEHYVSYLRKHYNNYFPEKKELAVPTNGSKELAVYSEKNDAINKIEDVLNKDNSKKSFNNESKPQKVKFNSEEEKKAFEKGLDLDYEKDYNKKTYKVSKIRKCFSKIKGFIKKHAKKIIAGVLVATAAIGGAVGIRACTYDQQDVNLELDNSKANSIDYDSTIPSEKRAEEISNGELSGSDILNKIPDDGKSNDQTNGAAQRPSDGRTNRPSTYSNNDVNKTEDKFRIGEKAIVTGKRIYETSRDASNDTNRLTPYYPTSDDRQISAIEYVSPDGKQHMTALTKEEQKQLEKDGWKVESFNLRNNTHNTEHEGWYRIDDTKKVK